MTHPDDVIGERYRQSMNDLAKNLDGHLNGDVRPKRVAFVLLVSEFGKIDHGRVNCISNGQRADIVVMLKEILARFESQSEQSGRA